MSQGFHQLPEDADGVPPFSGSRGSCGTRLAASRVARSILSARYMMTFGPKLPRIETEGVLPDVHPRASATAGEKGTEAGAMDEGTGASKAGAKGRAALRLCNLVAQSPRDAEGAVQA